MWCYSKRAQSRNHSENHSLGFNNGISECGPCLSIFGLKATIDVYNVTDGKQNNRIQLKAQYQKNSLSPRQQVPQYLLPKLLHPV